MVTKGNEVAISQHWPPAPIGQVTFTIIAVANAGPEVDVQGAIGREPYGMVAVIRDKLAHNGMVLSSCHIEVAQDLRQVIEQESERAS
jgi:hypothetical protein